MHPRRKSLAVFWGLCLVLGSAWALGVVHPAEPVTLRALGLESGLLGVGFGVLGWREFSAMAPARWVWMGLWGSMLALPAVISAGAGVALSGVTLTLIFTLVPAATVLAAGQQRTRFGPEESAMRLLVPAIAGAGGAALLLPFALPEGGAAQVWFVATVLAAVLTGMALVRLHGLLRGCGVWAGASVVSAGWAIVCGGLWWLGPAASGNGWKETLAVGTLQTCVTAALIVLSLWLLQRWTPGQFSARYLAAPLITIVEGAGIVRPRISSTLVAGVVLLAGSVWLLIREDAADLADSPAE